MFCTGCDTLEQPIVRISPDSSACLPCFVAWSIRRREKYGNGVTDSEDAAKWNETATQVFEMVCAAQRDNPTLTAIDFLYDLRDKLHKEDSGL